MAPYASGELDHGAASVGGLVVWGRPRQLARSAVETSARPRDGSGAYSAEMAKAARLNSNRFRRPTAESIDEPHYGNTPRRCPAFNFRPAIALCAPHPMSPATGKQRLVRELPKKTQTYRSLRFPAEAVLVPSAGTITLQIELRSDADAVSTLASGACPRYAVRSHASNGRHKDTGADHARPAILELQISTSPKHYRIDNGSAPAQLRSVTQQRRRMHSIGGGSPHAGT